MTLLELLVQELPKRGGWPDGAIKMSQDYDGEVWCWRGHDYGKVNSFDRLVEIADNHRKQGKDEDSGCFVTRKQYEAALAASKPEWDGEGLPPVGCECEFKADDGSWGVGAVLCVGKSRIFWLCHEDGDEYTSDINPKEFRPIRSEEDKKRDDNGLVDGYDVHHWSALAKERFHKYNELETEIIEVRRMLTGFYKDLKSGMKFYKIVTDEGE